MTAGGWRSWDRRTATAGRFGRWPNARAPTPIHPAAPGPRRCSGRRFRWSRRSRPRAPGPSRSWVWAPIARLDAGDHFASEMRKTLADRLTALFHASQRKDWLWFEDVLAYDNARLSQALIETGLATDTPSHVEAGLKSLRWLMALQTTSSGHFRPVGSESFGKIRRLPAAFDQQPVEAAAAISACLAASRADDSGDWPQRSDACIRLVSGRKRPANGVDRSRYGKLFRWPAPGPDQ